MLIDTTKKDTSTLSKMIFGLNAHFHNSYGLIDSQTVAFANFIDTLHMNIVDHAPDPIEPVYGYIDIPIPNVLGNLGTRSLLLVAATEARGSGGGGW